jgi:hypothetical protein
MFECDTSYNWVYVFLVRVYCEKNKGFVKLNVFEEIGVEVCRNNLKL